MRGGTKFRRGNPRKAIKMKKLLLFITAVFCSISLFAQSSDWGGVTGTVVNRAGRMPISAAELTLSQGGETVATAVSDAEGRFLMENLPNGMYDMLIKAPGYLDANVNVTIEGYELTVTYMGKGSEKDCMHIYHFAVHLKLTQYCKPSILQYQINIFLRR